MSFTLAPQCDYFLTATKREVIAQLSADVAKWYIAQIENILKHALYTFPFCIGTTAEAAHSLIVFDKLDSLIYMYTNLKLI